MFNAESYNNMELLRFTTAGSVDDGKSTLIGRLLYDSKSIFEDQLESLKGVGEKEEDINLANLTDGLKAEREQGITIDVAYRYFATPKRKFIIADTPGHVQYTRNMVTGASTANLSIILVDARKGIIEQTRRHAYLASLLRIPHIVVAVNKMDLVDYKEEYFTKIKEDFTSFATHLSTRDVKFIPISALKGDNIVDYSKNTPWYRGETLLDHLESVHIANDRNLKDPRFPVQYVIRPRDDEHHDFRGYAGQVSGGAFKVGDPVVVLPSGKVSKIKEIHTYDGAKQVAFAPMSVTLRLEDEIDISRGDLIVHKNNLPKLDSDLRAMICWMHEQPMQKSAKYLIKHGTKTVPMMLKSIDSKVNIETLEEEENEEPLTLNEIARVSFRTASAIAYDPYEKNRYTGSFVIINPATNATVGAGMLLEPENKVPLISSMDDYAI